MFNLIRYCSKHLGTWHTLFPWIILQSPHYLESDVSWTSPQQSCPTWDEGCGPSSEHGPRSSCSVAGVPLPPWGGGALASGPPRHSRLQEHEEKRKVWGDIQQARTHAARTPKWKAVQIWTGKQTLKFGAFPGAIKLHGIADIKLLIFKLLKSYSFTLK